MSRVSCYLSLVLALLCVSLQARAEGQGRTADDVQDFVFLADARPVLVRLHVYCDGKPYRVAWHDFVQFVFKKCDTDGDGVLNEAEVEKMPAAQILFGSNLNANFSAPTLFQLDGNSDGKVTLEELETYFRRNGGPAFQFQSLSAPRPNRPGQQPGVRQSRPATPDAFNEVLFGLLDTNKDGKLSRAELAAAPRVLLQRDEDDDEVVSAAEILPNADSTNPFVVNDEGMDTSAPPSDSAFVIVSPNESGIALARRLQMKYGHEENQLENRPDTRKVNRKELGIGDADFKQLDGDADGWLDLTELSLFGLRPPDLEVVIRLGKRKPQEPAAEVLKPTDRPMPLAARVKPLKDGLALDVGAARVELRTAAAAASQTADNRQQYQQQFKALDRDGNGYLDMNEVGQIPFFKSAFKVMDADGDGQLFEKEVLAYLDGIESLRAQAQSGSVMLTITEQGRGLFDLLDTDRDGRLSVRELRQAAKLLDTLDRNKDGFFSPDEVPRNYPLTLGPGAGDPFRGRGLVQQPMASRQPPAERTAGPVWFRKMDRNRDGDVSRREFLGSDAAFAKLDTDGDGLISVEEAEKADAKLRPKKPAK